jgi:polar amino acid transport system substrate-binding protein
MYLGILLALWASILLTATDLYAAEDDSRETCDRLIVSGHTNYPPFNYIDNGIFYGASIDLIRMIAQKIGLRVEIRNTGPWIRAIKSLTDGNIDLLLAIHITPERNARYLYTRPYAKDPIVMFTMSQSAFAFENWFDLLGKIGVTTRGDSWGADFDQFIKQYLTMMRVNSTDQMIDMIAQKRADYGIQGFYTLERFKRQTGANTSIRLSSIPIKSEQMYMAFSRQSPCRNLIGNINQALAEFEQNGTIARLIEHSVNISGS